MSVDSHECTDSELLLMEHLVLQGSIFRPLLFFFYINDFHKAITFSQLNHFTDDTLLYESPSLKDMNRKINYDMPRVTHWLRANKISLILAKTETILFHLDRTKIAKKLNFRTSRLKINAKTQAKYLGVILD